MAVIGSIVIWTGIILGLIEIITDIVYYRKAIWANNSLKSAALIFIFFQPIWYFFVYFVAIASHSQIETTKERLIKLAVSPIFAVL